MTQPKSYKGIFYFNSYDDAREYARVHQMPQDRIIHYKLGWAVQMYKSGPYAGLELANGEHVYQYRNQPDNGAF